MSKVLCFIAGALLVVAGYYGYQFLKGGTDTPILVGDGSMVIGSPVPLNTWSALDQYTIVHPKPRGKMAEIEVAGVTKDACPGNAPCTVKATWSNGSTLEVHTGPAGKGLAIRSSVPFLKGWDKYTYTWVYSTPNATLSDIAVQKGNSSQWKPVCTGPGCQVVIHYRS
jgi:hypothetical protein